MFTGVTRFPRRFPVKCIRQCGVVTLLSAMFYGTLAWCQTQEAPEKQQIQGYIQGQAQARLPVLQQSMMKLREIHGAMFRYADAHKRFDEHLPAAAIYDKNGKPLLSWRVAILPYLDEPPADPFKVGKEIGVHRYGPLYKQFKLDEAWDSDHNKKLLDQMPDVYKFPTVKGKSNTTFYQVLTGPDTVFAGNQRMKLEAITDGLSRTILVVEAVEDVPWTKPADVAYDAKKPLPNFGQTGFNTLWGDGAVRLLRQGFNEQMLRAAITPRGGETPGPLPPAWIWDVSKRTISAPPEMK
jgi:hypothetical protein